MNLSKTNVIIAQRTNEKAIMALSSLINALYELESHAVARLVIKDGRPPVLVLLSYQITRDYECLYENELPFQEDVRSYKFPPLDRVLTVSGKTLTVHRNLPDVELQNAMDDFVDSLDISEYDRDDEGSVKTRVSHCLLLIKYFRNPSEYLAMEDTYAPQNHHLQQVIKFRAVFPNGELPPKNNGLLKAAKPPEELLKKAASRLERLKAAANVKKGVTL